MKVQSTMSAEEEAKWAARVEAGVIHDSELAERVPIPHGTGTGYSYHKCRCEVCRTAATARHRDWYQRARAKR